MAGKLIAFASVLLLGAALYLMSQLGDATPAIATSSRADDAPARHAAPSQGISVSARVGTGAEAAMSMGVSELGTLGAPRTAAIAVSGRVLDTTNRRGVASVEVIFRGKSLYGERSTVSKADGAFSIRLPAGSYRLMAIGDGLTTIGTPSLVVGNTSSEASQLTVEVTKTAVITGTVRGPDGTPAPLAELSFTSTLGSRKVSGSPKAKFLGLPTPTTDEQGTYRIEVIPGRVSVQARNADGVASGIVAASVGGHTYNLDLEMPPAVVVSGLVQSLDKHPIAGAEVMISLRGPGTSKKDWRKVTTDTLGHFRVDGLSAGKLVVEAHAESFAASAPLVREATAGTAITDLVFVLGPGHSVSGAVVDANGSPVASARVIAIRPQSQMRPEALTAPDGHFELPGLDSVPYDLVASSEGVLRRVKGVRPPVAGLKIELASSFGIRGTVTDGRGKLVQSFYVQPKYLTGDDDGKRRTWGGRGQGFTSADGTFEMALKRPGIYDLEISATGYAPKNVAVRAPAGGWGSTQVKLSHGTSLSGLVRDERTGEPIPGARVSLTSGYSGAGALTDADGVFQLSGASPGKRTLVVSHPRYGTRRVENVDVSRSSSLVVELSGI